MTAQRTEEHTKIIVEFLERFMEPSKTHPNVFYSKITDEDTSGRLNALYDGTPLGGFFTPSKVQRARTDKWGPSKSVALPPPDTLLIRPPVPDAVGCFWERLDAIQHQMAAFARDLAEHRANMAATLDEQNKLLGVVRNGVIAIHNEWTGKK